MSWRARKGGKRGHPETFPFPESAIQVCLALKVLFGLPLRQTVGLGASLLERAGPDWPVPDCATLCRRQGQARIAVDTATGDVRGVAFPSSRQGDSPLLPEGLSQILCCRSDGEEIATVTADGAHDTRS